MASTCLSRFDPKTHERISKLEIDDSKNAPVFWNGYGWLSTAGYHLSGNFITKIDPRTNHVAGQILLPTEHGKTTFSDRGSMPAVLLAGEDSLWSLSEGSSRFSGLLIRRIQLK